MRTGEEIYLDSFVEGPCDCPACKEIREIDEEFEEDE